VEQSARHTFIFFQPQDPREPRTPPIGTMNQCDSDYESDAYESDEALCSSPVRLCSSPVRLCGSPLSDCYAPPSPQKPKLNPEMLWELPTPTEYLLYDEACDRDVNEEKYYKFKDFIKKVESKKLVGDPTRVEQCKTFVSNYKPEHKRIVQADRDVKTYRGLKRAAENNELSSVATKRARQLVI
jgi:hypothetical protein